MSTTSLYLSLLATLCGWSILLLNQRTSNMKAFLLYLYPAFKRIWTFRVFAGSIKTYPENIREGHTSDISFIMWWTGHYTRKYCRFVIRGDRDTNFDQLKSYALFICYKRTIGPSSGTLYIHESYQIFGFIKAAVHRICCLQILRMDVTSHT